MPITTQTQKGFGIETLRMMASLHGADDLQVSTKPIKKYMVLYHGEWIHFGGSGYSDFTKHRDPVRRQNYRARHSAIRLADGRRAYKVKESPAYWSWHILW